VDLSAEYLIDIVDRALTEDIDTGDVTTSAVVDSNARGTAVIVAKDFGVLSGLDLAALVFYQLDHESEFVTSLREGSRVVKGDRLVEIHARQAALLSGERTALNFLMHLSGIATLTAKFAAEVSHTQCRIIDTRKTSPGLRLLEKRAVTAGGGKNHRIGLFDMILIKDNHIAAAGTISRAVARAQELNRKSVDARLAVEVETQNLEQVREAVHLPIDRIMLDNFTPELAAEAVTIIREQNPDLEIEASGNMSLETVRAYAESGVDFISVGRITHSAPWLDLSMEFLH
jgi:nicotinate-nucleotide pyrophosphorylase (carboxylating)